MTTEVQPLWQVREYDPARDAGTVCAWAMQRGCSLVPELLSPVGVLIELDSEPVAAAWMFLCVGAPVGIMDKCLMAPGLKLSTVRQAARHCVDAFRAIAKEHGVAALYAYASPTLAIELESMGGHAHSTPLTGIVFPIS